MPAETADQWRRAALAELAVGRAPTGAPEDRDDPFGGLVRVVSATNAGDAARARAEAERLRLRHPDQAPVHHLRALLDLADGRPADAFTAAGRALEHDPADQVALAIVVRAGVQAADPPPRLALVTAADALVERAPSASALITAGLAALATGDLVIGRSRLQRALDGHAAGARDRMTGLARRVLAEYFAATGEVTLAEDLLLRSTGWLSTESALRARELVGLYEHQYVSRFVILFAVPEGVVATLGGELSIVGHVVLGLLAWVVTLPRASRRPWRRVQRYFTGPSSDEFSRRPGFVTALVMPVLLIGGTVAGVGVGRGWAAWAPGVSPWVALVATFLVLAVVDRLLVHRPFRRRRAVLADLAPLL